MNCRLNSNCAKLEVRCEKCQVTILLGSTIEDYDSADGKTFCYCPNCKLRLATVSHVFNRVSVYSEEGVKHLFLKC